MQYNPGSSQGIVDEVLFLVNATTNTYPLADITRNVNRWFDTCVSDILSSSNRWQWDDKNFTTLPKATTAVASGQQAYTFDSDWLEVDRIDFRDSSGNWNKLIPIDQRDIEGGYDDFEETDGIPKFFDVEGENINLFPAPNFSDSDVNDGSLKVWFRREPDYFTTTDTTQEPGIAAPYHRILSLGAAFDYALAHDLPKAKTLFQEADRLREEMKEYYASRNKYEQPRITPKPKPLYQ